MKADKAFAGSRIVVSGVGFLATDIARHFADAGATVVVPVGTTSDAPAGVEVVRADLSTQAGVETFAKRVLERLGSVDVIVNAAAPFGRSAAGFIEMTDNDVREDIVTTFMSAQRLDCALFPSMVERGTGVIIHVMAGARLDGSNELALSPIEAALTSYSKSLAATLGKNGIRVNVVVAGLLETAPLEREVFDIPLGRSGKTADVCELVAFLASSKAAFITGAQYLVDGGRTSRHSDVNRGNYDSLRRPTKAGRNREASSTG